MNDLHLHPTSKLINLPKPHKLLITHGRTKLPWWRQILDPGSEFATRWNHIFFFTCLSALFVDPLYFYLPQIGDDKGCLQMDYYLGAFVTTWRTVVDLFSFLHIAMKFRTAYVAPSSRVFGRGELVMDPWRIAMRYLKSDFAIDLAAALPLPQIVIWFIIPATTSEGRTAAHSNHTISLIIFLQYIPRMIVIFPLNQQINKTTGVVAKTAWSGTAYNVLLYMLLGHVIGATWYLLAIERQYTCWREECEMDHNTTCKPHYFDCHYEWQKERNDWMATTDVFRHCDAQSPNATFEFGLFKDAFKEEIATASFFEKYFYCVWLGLRGLSSYGQSLESSTHIGEVLFCCLVCLLGLVFFAMLIGNIQSYLQSTTARLEEWRVKRGDTEEWMRHRQLPPELQDRVRRFVQYKWQATRGVEEEEILRSLPLDLRRQIQRHLCLALVRRVPFFSQMDDHQLLDAICERLVSSLSTKDTHILREGDPVNEMIFVIRGQLESSTTNGGRSGFFNSITLKPGDFCGEELLTWALMPTSNLNLPSSTRTVKSLTEVEAFALRAQDLNFVAKQFKHLHSKKLQHAFRYYSHQWRSWGACFIQAAWRRFKSKKLAEELARMEYWYDGQFSDEGIIFADEFVDTDAKESGVADDTHSQHLGATILASRFAANTRRATNRSPVLKPSASSLKMPKLFKPDEPDFSADNDDG